MLLFLLKPESLRGAAVGSFRQPLPMADSGLPPWQAMKEGRRGMNRGLESKPFKFRSSVLNGGIAQEEIEGNMRCRRD